MSANSTSSTVPTPLNTNKVERTPLRPPLEGLRPHNEFWFEDGNLILVARDVAFRVYRSPLAEQSAMFADMTTASSKDISGVFDGCLVVRLSDSPEDLTHLLRIIMNKAQRGLNPWDEQATTPDGLSALARLSHKYRIHYIKGQALDLLRERYTDDFDDWRFSLGWSVGKPGSVLPTDCIGVVNIARLTDTPSLLPAALYSCCMLGADLLDGWKREDGCIEYLSSDDLKRCVVALQVLCKERADIMSKILNIQASAGCSNAAKCRAGLKSLVLSIVEGKLPLVTSCAALASWVDVIHTKALFRNFCSACGEELQWRDINARQELWNRLPEIFGITVPGWQETYDASDPDIID